MFFTKLGRVAAWVLLILGVSRFAMGMLVASIADDQQRALVARQYLGTGSSGDAIDQGLIVVGLAIALGILCEISKKIHSRPD